ncbi:hypothetical protein [Streptomyces sp. NPDC005336]|uniref:hypothetical protein n=1 Tax=Streptomyces sp. NPDC005336 TaxID=3157035 RepID=UPI0033B115FC
MALAMVQRDEGVPPDEELRLALRWAVVPANHDTEVPAGLKAAFDWLSTSDRPVTDLNKPEVLRDVQVNRVGT